MSAVLGTIAFCILIGIIIIVSLWYAKNKIIEIKESFALDELMKLHNDLIVMINKRLNEANWLTKRNFIKKHGREVYDAITSKKAIGQNSTTK